MKTILHILLLTFSLSQSLPKDIVSKYSLEKTCEKKNIEKDIEEDEAINIVFLKTDTPHDKSYYKTTTNHCILSALTFHNINLKIATPPPKETLFLFQLNY